MDGIGWILMIVIGGVAGLIAGRITQTTRSLTANVILGIFGAVGLNVVLAKVLDVHFGGIIGQLIIATIGATILIVTVQFLRRRG